MMFNRGSGGAPAAAIPGDDVPATALLEKAWNASKLKSRGLTMIDFMRAWKGVGATVQRFLSQKKAIALPGLGAWSFDAFAKPIFVLSDDFCRAARAEQDKLFRPAASGGSAKLNFAAVAKESGLSKDTCSAVAEEVVKTLKRTLNGPATATMRLSFLPVSELSYKMVKSSSRDSRLTTSKNVVTMKFLPGFLSAAGAQPVTASNLRQLGAAPSFTDKVRRAARSRDAADGDGEFKGSDAGGSFYSGGGSSRYGGGGGGSRRSGSRRGGSQQQQQQQQQQGGRGAGRGRPGSAAGSMTAEEAEDIIEKVKDAILDRGGSSGIQGLARQLKIMDDDGSKQLSKDELYYGLRDYGVDLKPRELKVVFAYFDRDRSGTISFDEFLRGIRGELNDRRLDFVHQAFDILDKTGDGEVTVEDLRDVYRVDMVPAVQEGKKTEDEALLEFMSQWDTVDKDGIVTREEFEEYYANVSASIDDDDYFELMMRNAWHISGGEGWCANTTNLRALVTHADGRMTVEGLPNDRGLDIDDEDAVLAAFQAAGIDAVQVELQGAAGDADKKKKKNNKNNKNKGLAATAAANRGAAPSNRVPHETTPDLLKAAGSGASVMLPVDPSALRPPGGWPRLRQILFNPPLSMEDLMQRLALSQIGTGLMPRRAFIAQIMRLDKKLGPAVAEELTAIACEPDKDPADLAAAAGGGAASGARARRARGMRRPKPPQDVDVSKLHAALVSKFGISTKDGSSSRVKRSALRGAPPAVVTRVKAKILERGGKTGLRGLRRVLKIMDDNGDLNLTADEFRDGMRDYGVMLSFKEVEDCMVYFDRDRSGTISFDEFIGGIRGDMNKRRLDLVHKAFDILDKTGDGEVTVDDLRDVYSVEQNVDVLEGKKTADEALAEFLDQWDMGDKDGIVTREEFEEYYRDISASVDGDDYFELMMRNAWHISGGEGWCANTTCRRVLVTHEDGHTSVEEITDDLGIDGDDEAALKRNLLKRGIRAIKIELFGEAGDPSKKKKKKKPPTNLFGGRAAGSGAKKPEMDPYEYLQYMGSDERNREAAVRGRAARQLQANFRGKKGRDAADRKVRMEQQEKERRTAEALERHKRRQELTRTKEMKWWATQPPKRR